MGVIFITHDMGVVAEVADRVLVMYRGDKVRRAVRTRSSPGRSTPTRALLSACRAWGHAARTSPRHFRCCAWTTRSRRAASVGSSPAPVAQPSTVRRENGPVLKVRDLTTTSTSPAASWAGCRSACTRSKVSSTCTPARRCRWWASPAAARPPPAVRCCSWSRAGPAPSNSTARTSARCAAAPCDAAPASSSSSRTLRLAGSAHDGRLLHHGAAADPRRGARKAAEERVRWLMDKRPAARDDRPLSARVLGGQRQRICIARALALNPRW